MGDKMTLEPEDLSPTDEAILDMLDEGRCVAPYIAEERDYSPDHIRNRLRRLVEHGHVKKVYKGLYELVDDPRMYRDY